MQTFVRYGLAFGAGFGMANVFQWIPLSSNNHRHADATPGAPMTAKGIDDPFGLSKGPKCFTLDPLFD